MYYQSCQYNNNSNESIINNVNFVLTLKVICKTCELKFLSKNLMHKHIRAEHSKAKVIKSEKVKSDKLMLQNQQILMSVAASLDDLIKKISIVKSATINDIKIMKGL